MPQGGAKDLGSAAVCSVSVCVVLPVSARTIIKWRGYGCWTSLVIEIGSHCPQTLGNTPASFFQALGVQHSWLKHCFLVAVEYI